jgi:hypothetical protein
MTLRFALPLSFAVLGLAGCPDKEFVSIKEQTPKRPIGDACVVDDDCETQRCVAGACSDSTCDNDDDCLADEICVLGGCEPADGFACEPDEAPLLNISAGNIEFDQVALGNTETQTLTISNLGDCILTLSSAGLASDGSLGFACEPCDPSNYPQRIPPQRTLDILVSYTPPGPGEASSTLYIDSDDATAGDDGEIAINLHASYDGIPSLVITPPELNFGFVEFVAGGAQGVRTESVEITNRGTGNAALIIERLYMDEGLVFTIPDELEGYNPDSPLVVPPYDPNDPATTITVPITFRPDDNREYDDRLVVRTLDGDNVPVNIRGNSLGPPVLSVSTNALEFRCLGMPNDACPVGEAYPLGIVAFRQVTLQNLGASEMPIDLTVSQDPPGDFTVSPSFIPPIQPGASIPLTVIYNPSVPSDPGNPLSPQQAISGFLNILSPTDGDLEIVSLAGYSKRAQGDAVLSLEMQFENADNSWAGNDFRDVDLFLEHSAFVCTKPIRELGQDAQGNLIVISEEDLCDEWNSYGLAGTVNWVGLGPYQEPERVTLWGLGPTGAEGEEFTVAVQYIENCANIPTGLLADLLGIGGSILLGILGGAVGVPISVPPDQISDFVRENCFDHDGSTTTVHISIDGEVVASPQVRLNEIGDRAELAHLVRDQGTFCDPLIGLPCP